MRFGDGWHPVRAKLDYLRTTGYPRLKQLADEAHKSVPALVPRIVLGVTDSPLPDDTRHVGQGTVNQIRRDLEALQAIGTTHVLLDWYLNNLPTFSNPEPGWRMLGLLAEKVFDLEKQTLR